ncbi:TonB-dependent receptor [Niveispirillum sp. BGYR6]|uniref:TonB-dependent receptor n=1 Tax=Niveispirillum sp. BGYR6 TaxID=2971249 RepID=UPI0022B9A2C7|nr:TonB-dependent receptor [Niveispirillum sp. BGYR6]MDG5496046.1 TonB-dependent receptor [Niveispirillum sp. BGYR6]
MKFRLSVTTALAFGSLVSPFSVLAQTAPAAGGQGGQVEDIIVTAQRRSESAQDVGVALSVLSGDELAKRGLSNVNQLQNQTPSLEVVPAFGGGQPQFRLRGVGFEDYATNNTPTVGVYVDEVAYPVPVATQGVLFDIDRVEVLRGPQGTLYGRNTTGGAINFISRRPTADFSAGIDAQYGRFDEFKAEGFVSGPINDKLRFRISGVTEQGGGFQKNRVTGQHLGDADRLFGRALVEFTPSETTTVTLNLHGGRDQSEQTGLYLFRPFTTQGYGAKPGPVIPADTGRRTTGWGLSPSFAGLIGFAADAKPQKDNESYGGSLTAASDLSEQVRLTSITAFDHLDRRELGDWDASASHESDTYWASNIDVFSQELRLSSTDTGPLSWVTGAYYSHQDQDEKFLTDFSQSLGIVTDTAYRQKVDSISGFGQVGYALTEQVKLVAGLRYENEKRKLRDFRTAIGGAPTFSNGNRDQELNEGTGKIGLEFRPQENLLLYANASRGVKSGGFTVYNSPNAEQIDPFKPETLYAYEIGFKSDLRKSVRLNGAAYYYDYRNQQVLGTIVNPQRGLIGRIVNAPKSEIYGGELELTVTPLHNLRLTQSVGFKKGEYKDYSNINTGSLTRNPVTGLYSASTIDLSGTAIPLANWSYQGSVAYTIPVGRFAVEAQADYAYRDKLPSFLGTTYDLPSRWIANATLTLHPDEGGWSAGLYGRNIFNTDYDNTRNFFLPNANIASPGRPATYGVRLTYEL